MKKLLVFAFLLCFTLLSNAQSHLIVDSVLVYYIEEALEENTIDEDFGNGPVLVIYLSDSANISIRNCCISFIDENGNLQKRITQQKWASHSNNIQVIAELCLASDVKKANGFSMLNHARFWQIVYTTLMLEIQLIDNKVLNIPVILDGLAPKKGDGVVAYYPSL